MTIMDTNREALVAELAAQHHDLSGLLRHRAATRPDDVFVRFLAYDVDPAGVAHDLTFAGADRQVDELAARLGRVASPGARVAVLTPQGNEFVVGFLAAIRAGLIAVPLFSPDLPGHGDRLRAVLADCDPEVVLATTANQAGVAAFVGDRRVLVDDEPDATPVDDWVAPAIDPAAVSYLQYTSGSTRIPAGVRITHRNVVFNSAQMVAHGDAGPGMTMVGWLPLFHDMGLVTTIGAVLVGDMSAVLMDPVAFLMRPQRWLEQLSKVGRSAAGGPNFAFDFCAKRIPAEERATFDLSQVAIMFNGAEPVSAGTLERFYDAFEVAGLPRGVVAPSYGLAEATVYVASARPRGGQPSHRSCDAGALSLGRVEDPRPGAPTSDLIFCGYGPGSELAIVDTVTGERLPDGHVGEIWVRSQSVGDGYWERPEQTAEVFGQQLGNAGGLPVDDWLRSGDLGVVIDGALAVTGRIKDLIIVDGRNHYPQDVERTVEDAHEVVGRHRTAAISADSDSGERAVLVAEVSRHHVDGSWDQAEVVRAITRAVSREHGLALSEVVLIEPDTIRRTTSGKIARAATAQAYRNGELAVWSGRAR